VVVSTNELDVPTNDILFAFRISRVSMTDSNDISIMKGGFFK